MRLKINLEDAFKRPPEHAYRGFDEARGGWIIPQPVNPHTHLRDPITQPEIFEIAVRESAKLYGWVTAMPNLAANRIRKPAQADEYYDRICDEAHQYQSGFDAVVPLYLEPDTDPEVIRQGYLAGAWMCAKIYPKAGTTNSDSGVDFRQIEQIFPSLAMIEKLDMRCLIHAEVVHDHQDELLVDRLREPHAIEVIERILQQFPKLKIVFEHISKKSSVTAVRGWRRRGYSIEATIAPQYLLWNSSVLFEKGMNPVNFSIPILGDEEDRIAVTEFMLNGGGMLGTDSAPHDVSVKSKPSGCAGGLFNEPVGLFVYFHLFRAYGGEDWFEKFVQFSSTKACEFYGRPLPTRQVLIVERGWKVPVVYENGTAKIIPMLAGETMPYSLDLI